MTEVIELKPETIRPHGAAQQNADTAAMECVFLAAARTRHTALLWLVLAVAAVTVLALIVVNQCIVYLRELMTVHVALAVVFAVCVAVLLAGLAWVLARAVWDYVRIGSVGCSDAVRTALTQDPDSDIVCAYVRKLAARYATHPRADVRVGVKGLYERMRVTQTGSDMLAELRAGVLAPLDAQAEQLIKTIALQTALGTAISPVAFVDVALVLWRSVVMVRGIAAVYDNRPGLLGTWRLMGQVLATVAFAGVADLAADAVNQIVGGGLAGKLSGAVGQGLTTGVLVARLGLAARIVCRPLPLQPDEARSSLRMFVSSIWDALRGKFPAE